VHGLAPATWAPRHSWPRGRMRGIARHGMRWLRAVTVARLAWLGQADTSGLARRGTGCGTVNTRDTMTCDEAKPRKGGVGHGHGARSGAGLSAGHVGWTGSLHTVLPL
jgi:hypothetical protein